MAETQFWKQTIFNSQLQASNPFLLSPSWEEKAFAEDSSKHLVWPPRSYSCNFCMRQFRSAQALGGHMNVHRRDRARLQQSFIKNIQLQKLPKPSSMAANNSISLSEEHEFSSVETDLSMNSFVRLQSRSFCGNEVLKRPKISISFCDVYTSSDSTEELDLELRLGDRPKVKQLAA